MDKKACFLQRCMQLSAMATKSLAHVLLARDGFACAGAGGRTGRVDDPALFAIFQKQLGSKPFAFGVTKPPLLSFAPNCVAGRVDCAFHCFWWCLAGPFTARLALNIFFLASWLFELSWPVGTTWIMPLAPYTRAEGQLMGKLWPWIAIPKRMLRWKSWEFRWN